MSALRSALTLAVVLVAAHLFGRIRGAVVDCSRAPVAEVSPALRERLARLDSDLLLSYAASSEASMPRELRGVAEQVVRLLRSIEAAAGGAGGRVRVQILDPGADASLPTYLAGIGLAPFRSRSLALDAEVETSVWSSLRIAYGAHGSASVRAVTPEVLAGLQPLILAHLDLLEKPRRARVALSAPEEYRSLRKALRARAELLECDFDATAKIPEDADLFLWIDPTEAGPRQVAALRAALGRGSSVVVAGSELRAAFVGANPKPGSSPAVRFERTRFPPALYRELGLAPVEGIAVDVASKGSPALLRSTGADQDFRGLGAQPNGTLLFAAPTAIEPDAARLAELGLELTTLASSATTTRARPWREAAVPEADLRDTSAAVRAPRLPLLAILSPDRNADPWRGSLVVSAASTPFSDDYLREGTLAHEELLAILVRQLASPERLAIEAAGVPGPPRIPEVSPLARNLWRAGIALASPCLLAFLYWIGHRPPRRRSRSFVAPSRPVAATASALGLLLAVHVVPRSLSADWTRDGWNDLGSETRAILARRVSREAPVRIDVILSPEAEWPHELRSGFRVLGDVLRRFAAAAPGLEVRRIPTADLASLARDGVLPLESPGAARRFFASVVCRKDDRVETLSFPESAELDHAEFRLAAAIERLSGAKKPRLAVVASAPRLSPAEALEYQKKGLFAPGGSDVFGEARALLDGHDFAVTQLDSAKPEIPEGADALLCFQPRRDAAPVIAAAGAMLARGGGVLVAAQHFSVRSRRTQDSGMVLALWPEPQYDDLDRLYFPKIGVDLRRDVVFDEVHGAADVATQVERERWRFQSVRERAASPLFVRTVPDGFDRSSPVVRGISELVLPCPSRLQWNA
ncbi:MAG TPA: Gldg family protein, partial [Thermoanaerobaculia bacterium]|nr:Gldg family protein [Thermoanaerobaculia bacterium]